MYFMVSEISLHKKSFILVSRKFRMEIIYVLHIIPSSYKDMGTSEKKKTQKTMPYSLFGFSCRCSIFIFNCIVFFPFLNCPSDVLSCFLSLHGDNRRRRWALYWTLSINFSLSVALVTRKVVEEKSQLSCEAFPKKSSELLFLYRSP